MFKNVVFDYGMTLIRFDGEEISCRFMDEAQAAVFAPVFFDRLYWARLDKGTLGREEMLDSVLARLPQGFSRALVGRVYDGWFEDLPPIPGMPALVAALRARGTHLYLLSDISREFAAAAHRLPIVSDFDGRVTSGTLGITKPDVRIFRYLLDTYRLAPSETVFIDDRAENTAAAEALGITGYHFDGNADRFAAFLGISL